MPGMNGTLSVIAVIANLQHRLDRAQEADAAQLEAGLRRARPRGEGGIRRRKTILRQNHGDGALVGGGAGRRRTLTGGGKHQGQARPAESFSSGGSPSGVFRRFPPPHRWGSHEASATTAGGSKETQRVLVFMLCSREHL